MGRDESLKVLVDRQVPDWGDYLARHPDATIYHDPRWGRVLHAAYRLAPTCLTARKGAEVVGVSVLILQRGLFGTHLCSLPYFDAAGILADNAEARESLLAACREQVRAGRAAWAELRQAQPLAGGLPARTDKVTMHLALPPDPDVLWKALDAKVRNQVRKADKEGLSVVDGGAELLDEFFAVYLRNMRDLGSPPHSLEFFRAIVEEFGSAVRLFCVRDGAAPMAASFTLADRGALRVPWAGSDWRFRGSNANMRLYWAMLEHGCRQGAPVFDFGRGTREGGTYKFKKQWGAHEVPLFWHYLLAEGQQMPEVRPDSGKYKLIVECWKKLPLPVARTLGPWLIRQLS